MDNVNYSTKLLPVIVRSRALEQDPFILLDVGCGMGLDPAWRLFEPDLHAHGFDPQIAECERLAAAEHNPNVRYHAAYVGPPPSAPDATPGSAYFEPAMRSSGMRALANAERAGHDALSELNAWQDNQLTEERVTLTDFARNNGLTSIDFVKIDTDGGDLGVLESVEDIMDETGILGFMVETPFTGTADPHSNSFHNIDRLLRSHGYLLFNFSVQRYSRAVLPAEFRYEVLGSTVAGQTTWGDTIYLRDGGSPDYATIWGSELSPTKLLKLASLYELFELPDCAVELLLRHQQELQTFIDVKRCVDALTPPLNGRNVSHAEYVRTFESDPFAFYPPRPTVREQATKLRRLDVPTARRLTRRVVGGLYRRAVRVLRAKT